MAWRCGDEARIVADSLRRLAMTTSTVFPHATFLARLQSAAALRADDAPLPAPLARLLFDAASESTAPAARLIALLEARKTMLRAAFDTEQVADELRRYQKFAKPGQPSPHIVQLRRQQAVVRQAVSRSKQTFIEAAAAFVRVASIEVPQRVALEAFVIHWIDENIPKDIATAR